MPLIYLPSGSRDLVGALAEAWRLILDPT